MGLGISIHTHMYIHVLYIYIHMHILSLSLSIYIEVYSHACIMGQTPLEGGADAPRHEGDARARGPG